MNMRTFVRKWSRHNIIRCNIIITYKKEEKERETDRQTGTKKENETFMSILKLKTF